MFSLHLSTALQPCSLFTVLQPCCLSTVPEPCCLSTVPEPCSLSTVPEPCSLSLVLQPCSLFEQTGKPFFAQEEHKARKLELVQQSAKITDLNTKKKNVEDIKYADMKIQEVLGLCIALY